MGLMREFFCPLDGKKLRVIDDSPPTQAMNRDFIAVKCVARAGREHIWMVSEDPGTFMLMRQKMGRE